MYNMYIRIQAPHIRWSRMNYSYIMLFCAARNVYYYFARSLREGLDEANYIILCMVITIKGYISEV